MKSNIEETLGLQSASKRAHESDSEVEEEGKAEKKIRTKAAFDAFGAQSDSDDSDIDSEEDEEDNSAKTAKKATVAAEAAVAAADDIDEEEDTSKDLKPLFQESSLFKKKDPKTLSSEKLSRIEKKLAKTGVIYLSKIPPYMKPSRLRQILEKFGKIDRLFLKPETSSEYLKRVKSGGNRKKKYVEGWVEFLNKKDAKLCVATMNGNPIGGKKGNYYHDDILNMKYLKSFKWLDLTNQMAKENESKENKMMMEISQQNKMNKKFVENVERVRRMEYKKKKEAEQEAK